MIQFRFMWIFSSFLLQRWMISTCCVVVSSIVIADETSSSHLYYHHHNNIETTIIHDDDDDKDRNFCYNDKERQSQSKQCHMINDHSIESPSPILSDSISTSCDTMSTVTSLSLSDAATNDDEIIITTTSTTQWNHTYNDPNTNNDVMMKIPPFIYRFIILLQYCETFIIPMILIPIYTISVILYVSYRIYQKFYMANDTKRHSHTVVPSTIPNHNNETNDFLIRMDPKQSTAIQIQNDHDQTITATNIIQQEQQQPIDMSGSYQMTSHSNLDMFLSVQGVPWPLRRAASSVLPIHHIIHDQNQLIIKIEAKSSGFTTQTQYTIDGPPVETNVRGRIFSDTVYYYYENCHNGTEHDDNDNNNEPKQQQCVGIMTEKRAITEGYIVTVLRKLVNHNNMNDATENINDGTNHQLLSSSNLTATTTTKNNIQQIHMTSTVSFPNEPEKDDVICIQLFDRIA